MKKDVERLLASQGTDMVLTQGDLDTTIRGFFWAVNSSSWQSIESLATPLGEYFRGQYSFLGSTGCGAREGDTLTLGGRSYLLRRVEPFWQGNEMLFLWGLCVEKGVNDTWGSQS